MYSKIYKYFILILLMVLSSCITYKKSKLIQGQGTYIKKRSIRVAMPKATVRVYQFTRTVVNKKTTRKEYLTTVHGKHCVRIINRKTVDITPEKKKKHVTEKGL